MKIGYIAEPYEESKASGMGYAVLQVLRHMLAANSEHEIIVYSACPIRQEVVAGKYTNILVPQSLFRKFLYFLFLRDKPDVLVFMLPLLPLWTRGMRTVPIFHELGSQKITPASFKEKVVAYVRDQLLMPHTLRQAAHLVSVSHATKDDIVEFYKVAPEKITVLYNGYQDWSAFKTPTSEHTKESDPYFFFAGVVKSRKNVHGLVDGFIEFKERTPSNCKLLVAGKHGGEYHQRMVEKLTSHNLQDDVRFLGYVSNEQMYHLFTNALACVFPSFNEGFGMPIVEAMSLGTPVITSNCSATVEVAGGAALLIDPHDAHTISVAMEEIYTDPSKRQQLIEKGLERSALFSWNSFATEFLSLLKKYGT